MANTEILVHISAPSGARDDARYRAQVEAILNFQSLSRQLIIGTSDDEPESDTELDNRPSEPIIQGPVVIPTDDSQCKQPLLLVSTGRQHDESVDVQPAICSQECAENHDAPQNQLRNDTCLASPRTQAETRGSNSEADRGHELSGSLLIPVPASIQIGKDSLETPISVISDSQPESSRTNAESLPRAGSQVHSSVAAVNSPPAKRRCLGLASARQGPEPSTEDSLPVLDRNKQCPERGQPTGSHSNLSVVLASVEAHSVISFDSLPLIIKPPQPPISREQFVTHVTPTLTMLSKRLNPARTYRLVEQTRDLDPLERGHWYLYINILTAKDCVDDKRCRTWDIAFFSRFWSFLSDFISKEGRAGWGVWCILEDASKASTLTTTESRIAPQEQMKPTVPNTKQVPSSTTHIVVLKLYAWGEIASHMYLLLFLASERKIRRMGAQWRDGEDKVIIQMT